MSRRMLLTVVMVAFASFATGCSKADTAHSQADIDYLLAVAHDEAGTSAVARVMGSTATNDQARDLGLAISRSELRYVERATTLLRQWQVGVPEPGVDEASQQLQNNASATFDTDALTLLRTRHQATVATSEAELTGGQNDEAKKLARDLIAARNAELGQINGLLATDR